MSEVFGVAQTAARWVETMKGTSPVYVLFVLFQLSSGEIVSWIFILYLSQWNIPVSIIWKNALVLTKSSIFYFNFYTQHNLNIRLNEHSSSMIIATTTLLNFISLFRQKLQLDKSHPMNPNTDLSRRMNLHPTTTSISPRCEIATSMDNVRSYPPEQL